LLSLSLCADLGDLLGSSESEVTGSGFAPFWGSLAVVAGDPVAVAGGGLVVVRWADSSSSSSSSLYVAWRESMAMGFKLWKKRFCWDSLRL
jgi:hypothetical protein